MDAREEQVDECRMGGQTGVQEEQIHGCQVTAHLLVVYPGRGL